MKTKLIAIIGGVIVIIGVGFAVWYFMKDETATTVATNFDSGIYYRLPNLEDQTGILSRVGMLLGFRAEMSPVDFDIAAMKAVYPDNDRLFVLAPNGSRTTVTVDGLYQMARPTLSPDASRVAVQATTQIHPRGETADPTELEIFVVNLSDGTWQQISQSGVLPTESPTWFNTVNRIAYSSFSVEDGVDIHIYDLDVPGEVSLIQDAGWHGLAISKDDTKLLIPNSLEVRSLPDGRLLEKLESRVVAGLSHLAFVLALDAGDADSPFLDGDWSPNGTMIIFDVVVTESGTQRIAVVTATADGSDVTVVAGPLVANPEFSNNFNFSQLNPVWL